ncbi:MAG: hypothetical protein F4X48_02180 [Acidimicrobiia bacterium]|nr:hypothetical protein [Acidimicrobiia bacterium]MYC57388.1 hypothetical protein [Acidimicrobiia bacterium]MYI31127.1 hypothetical protein [Acidimicrobiia bacterium]
MSEPIREEKRLALLERLTESIGREEAKTLMESLPPVQWTQLATKEDLRTLEERLRTDFNGQFAQLNAKIDGGFAKIDSRFAKIDSEFTKVDGKFEIHRAEITLQLAKQTRAMVITFIGFALSVWIPVLLIGLS